MTPLSLRLRSQKSTWCIKQVYQRSQDVQKSRAARPSRADFCSRRASSRGARRPERRATGFRGAASRRPAYRIASCPGNRGSPREPSPGDLLGGFGGSAGSTSHVPPIRTRPPCVPIITSKTVTCTQPAIIPRGSRLAYKEGHQSSGPELPRNTRSGCILEHSVLGTHTI